MACTYKLSGTFHNGRSAYMFLNFPMFSRSKVVKGVVKPFYNYGINRSISAIALSGVA